MGVVRTGLLEVVPRSPKRSDRDSGTWTSRPHPTQSTTNNFFGLLGTFLPRTPPRCLFRTQVGADQDKSGCMKTLVERCGCTHSRCRTKVGALLRPCAPRWCSGQKRAEKPEKVVDSALRRVWACGPRAGIAIRAFRASWDDLQKPRPHYTHFCLRSGWVHPLLSIAQKYSAAWAVPGAT